jgi:hypothetical protein
MPIRHSYPAHHARKDPDDLRDRFFRPGEAPPPPEIPLERYLRFAAPVIDQGKEHACTGIALATVADYLFRKHHRRKGLHPVSGRMMYEMARRSDTVNGYHQGSYARGAMKGWHRNGVCGDALWPYHAFDNDRKLTPGRSRDARQRPMLSYYRVPIANLDHLRAAIADFGVVYVTAVVHKGWRKAGRDGRIPYTQDTMGAHAFVLVGYNDEGFWLHNSKGSGWGRFGYGLLSFADWLENAQDAWVAEIAAHRRQAIRAGSSASSRSRPAGVAASVTSSKVR